MSRGDRYGQLAPYIILLVGLVVVFFLSFEMASYRERSRYEQQRTNEYARDTQTNINRSCVGVDGAAQAECISKIIEATNEHQRAERDLTAQQEMARWSLYMLITSALTITITAIGVYYVRDTLLVTRTAMLDTRQIGEAQVRAYLGFEVISGDVAAGKQLKFQVRITNHGQSPAQAVAVASNTMIRSKNWERQSEDGGVISGEYPSVTIHPSGFYDVFTDMDPPIHLSAEVIFNLKDDKSCVFASVLVFYQDVFEIKWESQFCFEFSGTECFQSGKVRISNQGNYTQKADKDNG